MTFIELVRHNQKELIGMHPSEAMPDIDVNLKSRKNGVQLTLTASKLAIAR